MARKSKKVVDKVETIVTEDTAKVVVTKKAKMYRDRPLIKRPEGK